MPLRIFYLLFLLIVVYKGNCQTSQEMYERLNCPVTINNLPLKYPFAGGLNSSQYNTADLNNDGIDDLVIFDRLGDVILTFINDNINGAPAYSFRPEYACHFPPVTDWMVIKDYNNDNAPDIFCSAHSLSSQEFQVYKGYYENGFLKFSSFLFHYPGCVTCDNLVSYVPDPDMPGFWNNLPITKVDIPSFNDVDGDGDLDILTFDAFSGGHVWYYKNTSVELGFDTDSLKWQIVDKCWGRFYEGAFAKCYNDLSPASDSCATGFGSNEVDDRNGRHPGSTIMSYDQEGDGDLEIVLGDISFSCLNMSTNIGTPSFGWIGAQDSIFPNYDVPALLTSFPAAYYLDVDNDNKNDMIVTPNSENVIEDQKGVWFYKNIGSNSNHIFQLQRKDLFQGDMIDIGSISHPTFVDYNADGLLDIVAGNYGFFTPSNAQMGASQINSRLFLFKNVGDFSSPAYVLEDDNWLNFAQFFQIEYDFAPTFGDLDNDGDLDLMVGCNSGILFYCENTAAPNQPMQLNNPALGAVYKSIDVGSASTPFIYDLDNDGKKDLIIGERLGNINYYKNIGSPNEPDFASVATIEQLGKVNTRTPPNNSGFSAPNIIASPTGPILFTGEFYGQLQSYQVLGATTDSFPVITKMLGNVDVGDRSYPSFSDINNDGILDIVLGNSRGGFDLFSSEWVDCTSSSNEVTNVNAALQAKLFPNPTTEWLQVHVAEVQGGLYYQTFNALGQKVQEGSSDDQTFTISTQSLASGHYLLRLWNGTRSTMLRFQKVGGR